MIVVTGGTGMVGSYILLELIRQGKQVKAIKRYDSKTKYTRKIFDYFGGLQSEIMFSKIEWIDCDILDYDKLMDVFRNADVVYHSAAIVSFDKRDKNLMQKINVTGTENVVNICLELKIPQLVYISSVAALGTPLNGEMTNEEHYPSPDQIFSGYSLSKYKSEMEVWRGIYEGLNTVIVNPSIILGAGNWQHGSPQLIATVGKGLKYYTKGISGFVDVRDVAKIAIELSDKKIFNERFILSAENISYQTLFEKTADALHVKRPSTYASSTLTEIGWRLAKIKSIIFLQNPLITKQSARSSHKQSYYSNKKIIDVLNYNFIPIEQSIKDFCACYRQDFPIEKNNF